MYSSDDEEATRRMYEDEDDAGTSASVRVRYPSRQVQSDDDDDEDARAMAEEEAAYDYTQPLNMLGWEPMRKSPLGVSRGWRNCAIIDPTRISPFNLQINDLREIFREKLMEVTAEHRESTRYGIKFSVLFRNPENEFYITFGSKVDTLVSYVTRRSDINKMIKSVLGDEVIRRMMEERMQSSDSRPIHVGAIYIFSTKIRVPRGGSYIPTPEILKNKRCLINVKNDKKLIHDCLRLSLLALKHHGQVSNVSSVSTYEPLLDEFKTPMQTDPNGAQTEPTPCNVKTIARFEELNHIRIYVCGLDDYQDDKKEQSDPAQDFEETARCDELDDAYTDALMRGEIQEQTDEAQDDAYTDALMRGEIEEQPDESQEEQFDFQDSLEALERTEEEQLETSAPFAQDDDDDDPGCDDDNDEPDETHIHKRVKRDLIVPYIRSPHHTEREWTAYNVLFIPDDSTVSGSSVNVYGHFIAITKLAALVSSDAHTGYACPACHYFTRIKKLYDDHLEIGCYDLIDYGCKLVCPSKERSEVKFKRIAQMHRLPIICTMDTETCLRPISRDTPEGTKTQVIKEHFATQYSITTHIDEEAREFFALHNVYNGEKSWDFTDGPDWEQQAFNHLIRVAKALKSFVTAFAQDGPKCKKIVMTDEDNAAFARATNCYLCNHKVRAVDKVRDHNHVTGVYRGMLCSKCNIAYNLKRAKLVVWTHNLRGYDENLYIPILAQVKNWSISVLANSTEKYLSFSLLPSRGLSAMYTQIAFIDSMQHFNGSLDMNVSMLMNSTMQIKSDEYRDITKQFECVLRDDATTRDDKGASKLTRAMDELLTCAPYVLSSSWGDESFKYGDIDNPRAIFTKFAMSNTDQPDECKQALARLYKYYEDARPRITRKFAHTVQNFGPDDAWFFTRKGAMPYEYITCNETLFERQLPPIEKWANTMGETISAKRYNELIAQFHYTHCKNILDFQTMYIASDTTLLADLVENWREYVHGLLHVDPANFVTISALSWAAIFVYLMREHPGVHVHAIESENAHHLIRNNIRGGISVITRGHCKANNPLMGAEYDPSKPTTWIMYLDANALYSSTMLEKLPEKGIDEEAWIDDIPRSHDSAQRDGEEQTPEDLAKYILENPMNRFYEVDLHIPEKLHDRFNDYPPLMSNRAAVWEEQSPFMQEKIRIGYGKEHIPSDVPKLIPSLQDEIKQLHHARYIRFLIEQGIQVTRIYRGLQFDECPFLRSYVQMLSKERAKWKKSDPLLYAVVKLLLNAVYGRTLMNVLRQLNLRVESDDTRIAKLARRFNCRSVRPLCGDLRAIDIARSKITLNQPIAMGFAILEYSKLTMMSFYYNVLVRAYGQNVRLLMTDTDSVIVEITTPNLIEDIVTNDLLRNALDLSEERASTFGNRIDVMQNAAVYGKFKTEVPFHDQIVEFIGLRSKVYALRLQSDKVKALAKGVDRAVKDRCLQWKIYEQALRDIITEDVTVHRFVHHQLQLQTVRQQKRALCAVNDKRFYIDFEQPSLAFGHWRISKMK